MHDGCCCTANQVRKRIVRVFRGQFPPWGVSSLDLDRSVTRAVFFLKAHHVQETEEAQAGIKAGVLDPSRKWLKLLLKLNL